MRLGWIALLAFAWACGDDSTATDAGSDAETDATGDVLVTDTPSSGVDIEAIVYEGGTLDPMTTTIADAQIAAVLPGGTRVELTSDSTGMFVLENVDFSLGSLNLSVWKEGYRVGGGLDITEIPDDIEGPVPLTLLPIPDEEPPTLITVSGTITGLAAGDFWSVSSSLGGFDQADDDDYSFEVPAGEPFTVFIFSWSYDPDDQPVRGVEQDLFHSWVSVAHEGSETNVVVDLDLPADPDMSEVQEVTGSVLLPEGFGEGSRIAPLVADRSFAPFLGAATISGISADGTRAQYTVKYVQPDYVDELITQFRLGMGAAEASQIFTALPPEGDSDLQFLAPVEITTPAFGTVPSAFDEIVYRDPGGANTAIFLSDDDSTPLLYLVVPEGEPGTRTIAIPQPPSGFDASSVLGTTELTARVQHCAADEALPGFCALFTNSRAFGVMP